MVEKETVVVGDQVPVVEGQQVEFENVKMKYIGMAVAKAAEGGSAPSSVEPPPLSIDNYVKHGLGIEVNKEEGTRYEGQFKMGQHHGKGRLKYEATGDCYNGDWVKGNIEGEGTFTFSNGDMYAGEFTDNMMKQGILNKANGDEYAGDFVND